MFIISINQIIVFNNQNRRRLRQINHTKKVFRNRFFKINRIDSLNLCFRIRFNKKTRSILNLKINRNNRIVLLMIFLTLIINIKIDNRLINDLIFRHKINEFILLKMIKKINMKIVFQNDYYDYNYDYDDEYLSSKNESFEKKISRARLLRSTIANRKN